MLEKEWNQEQDRRLIVIKTDSEEEELRILDKIHNQLVGNEDYVESRIILNDSATRRDGTENEVHVYIFKDAKSDPEITI